MNLDIKSVSLRIPARAVLYDITLDAPSMAAALDIGILFQDLLREQHRLAKSVSQPVCLASARAQRSLLETRVVPVI